MLPFRIDKVIVRELAIFLFEFTLHLIPYAVEYYLFIPVIPLSYVLHVTEDLSVKLYFLIFVNFAPFRETSTMSPLAPKTNATTGSFNEVVSSRLPPPTSINATLPSTPTSHPATPLNCLTHPQS